VRFEVLTATNMEMQMQHRVVWYILADISEELTLVIQAVIPSEMSVSIGQSL
jgi:hypothetical protein